MLRLSRVVFLVLAFMALASLRAFAARAEEPSFEFALKRVAWCKLVDREIAAFVAELPLPREGNVPVYVFESRPGAKARIYPGDLLLGAGSDPLIRRGPKLLIENFWMVPAFDSRDCVFGEALSRISPRVERAERVLSVESYLVSGPVPADPDEASRATIDEWLKRGQAIAFDVEVRCVASAAEVFKAPSACFELQVAW